MKKKRKKGRSHYDPMNSLQLSALPWELEPLARDIFEKACCGTRSIWPDIADAKGIENWHPDLLQRFMSMAHAGMRAAQQLMIDRIVDSPILSSAEEVLFRGIADAIAWQFLEKQLCHARVLFKGQVPPNLAHSNFESVVAAMQGIMDLHSDAMPLISDLTSFIQVGDILAAIPGRGIIMAEVKEGTENRRILNVLHSNPSDFCQTLHGYIQQSNPKSLKQFERVLRQADRMTHFTQIMSSGLSDDPDTGFHLRIPEAEVVIDEWNDVLDATIEASTASGWGINIIDDCLYLGCYSGFLRPNIGHKLFNFWFDQCGGTTRCPRGRLFDSMIIPLALPLFSRSLPEEIIFDLLFGRLQICMGINIDALLSRCQEEGLQVRFGSNKEASQLDQRKQEVYRHQGKVIFIGDGQTEMAIADGLFVRILYHGQRPLSLIKALLKSQSEMEFEDALK
jgi:hypothetical protein